jgi:PAS domain S-box-containing protein
MSGFSSIGGLMLGIFGLLIAVYGLDIHEPFSNDVFFLGIVLAASGGIIVWQGIKRQKNPMAPPKYQVESPVTELKTDSIRYRTLYEGMPVMLRTVNTNGIILECNASYVKNFGHSKSDIIGKSIFDHVADKSIDDMKKCFEAWKQSGRVENIEIWFKRIDGTVFPALLSANNISDDRGKLLGSNTAIREISEIYQARKVLDEHERQKIQIDELQKMDSAKGDFYMMVAKESQIPIAPILKYSKLLNETHGKLDKKQVDAISEIYDNAVKLDQLMIDIIDVQKLNTKTMEFKKAPFTVDSLMDEVVDLCKPMMKDKKIEFVDSSSTKKSITSDKALLSKVFFNLIQNAVDFVPAKDGRIEIGAKEDDGNSVVFYVKDNGIGILEKKKDFVFKKFYQVDISFKRKYGGSGFGLVICKGIVENLAGKIWFDTKEGEGTTFYFSVPA